MQRYSLTKISRELGVSKAAVSLALSGKARRVGVSEELEKRILDFCRKVDYQPNIHARRLNSKLVRNIGILLERFEEGATALMLSGIVEAADRAGFRVTIQIYRPEQHESIAFDWLLNREIDGVIFYGLELPESWQARFLSEKWPVIGVGIAPGSGIPSVNVNNFTATYTLTGSLIRQGCREFHYMAGTEGSYPSRERERGFRAALREAGLLFPENRMHVAGFSRERAQEITFELLGRNQLQPGSAVVCATDLLAIGTIPGAAPLRLPRTRRFCRDRRQRLLRRRGFLPEPHDLRVPAERTGGRRGRDAARPAAEQSDRAGARTARQARAGGIRTAPGVNASPDRNGILTENTGQSPKHKLVYKQFIPHLQGGSP